MCPDATPSSSNETRRLRAPRGDTRSVLVVDPDGDCVDLLSRELCGAGYEVIVCSDAVEFLLQLGRRSFDLVLLEIDLPDIDGCLLVDVLAQKWVDAEILLMTSMPPTVLAAHVPCCRPEEVLRKPVAPGELLRRVARALHASERDGQGGGSLGASA